MGQRTQAMFTKIQALLVLQYRRAEDPCKLQCLVCHFRDMRKACGIHQICWG
jgi:hypothetical protein